MSKKKMYGMLLFIISTFTLLGFIINNEFSDDSTWTNKQNESEYTFNQLTDDIDSSTSEDQIESTEVEVTELEDEISQVGNEPSTLEQDDNNSDVTINDSGDTVMVFSGDIFMSDYIIKNYSNEGLDGILSKELQEEFEQADIAMVNQEFSFSNRGTPMKNKQYTFRVDPKWVQIFNDMKLDIVTLANNHTLDYGIDALIDTFDTLDTAKIQYVGAGNNLTEARNTKYFDVNHKTIAILGASRVIPVVEWNAGVTKPGLFTTYDPKTLIEEIELARELSDYIVVYVHWGLEQHTSPEKYQRNMAKQYIDAGADLVIGSHPHVLQGIEYYKDKPIIYSLGNFMFYNSIKQTAVLKVTLDDKDEVQVQLLPCKAENALTFTLEDPLARSEFYRYMTEISYEINIDENGIVLY